jgi:glycerophosphoryl diester phosphodiesterase
VSFLRFVVCLTGLLIVWRWLLWQPRGLAGVTRQFPLVLGHRGVRGARPENTLEAFALAFESGLDGIECDVQRSRDGQLVLFHDFTLHDKQLTKLTYIHLKSIDSKIPKLQELFELAKAYPGTLLNVELKIETLRSDGLERDTLALIKQWGLADRVLISSFNPLSLLRVRLIDPNVRMGLLYSDDMPWWMQKGHLAGWLHVDAIHPHYSRVDEKLIKSAKVRNLMVNTWTVNDPMRISSLCSLGVTAIIGDDPTVLLAYRTHSVGDEWRGASDHDHDSKIQTYNLE